MALHLRNAAGIVERVASGWSNLIDLPDGPVVMPITRYDLCRPKRAMRLSSYKETRNMARHRCLTRALGRKIRELRKKNGWSLDELASKGEVSKSYLWELENRETASRPSAEKITKIAVALDVTPEYLIDDTRTEATVDERDKAFFRRYQGASEDAKAKIDQILKLLDE
ncbi:MAG: helix-turn-helix domain-containing protein [Methylocella sp.]